MGLDTGNICNPCLIRRPPLKPPFKHIGRHWFGMLRIRCDPVGPFVGRAQLLALPAATHPFRVSRHPLCPLDGAQFLADHGLLADDVNGGHLGIRRRIGKPTLACRPASSLDEAGTRSAQQPAHRRCAGLESGMPSRLAASAGPAVSARRSASILNSVVYCRFVADETRAIIASIHHQFIKFLMYVKPGQDHPKLQAMLPGCVVPELSPIQFPGNDRRSVFHACRRCST
jgi:hypothetical protein